MNRGLKVFPDDKNLLTLLRIAEPKAADMRKEKISGLAPVDRYKAEGNEFFKSSRFPQAIESVCGCLCLSSVVHQGHRECWRRCGDD